MKKQIERYKDFVRPFYAARDIAHDFDHIERIIRRIDVLSNGTSPPPQAGLYFGRRPAGNLPKRGGPMLSSS
jgi:hypothetical protein